MVDSYAAVSVAHRLRCATASISSRDSASRSSARRMPPTLRNVWVRCVVMTQIVVTLAFRRNRREYQNPAVAREGFFLPVGVRVRVGSALGGR